MQDMQAYLRKLHLDAVDCALISKRATDAQKKELFDRIADHLAMLASELEREIEAKGTLAAYFASPRQARPRPCGFTLSRIGGAMGPVSAQREPPASSSPRNFGGFPYGQI